MKKLLILPLMILLSLSGCKKPEDVTSSISQPTSTQTDPLPPLDPLKQRGVIPLSKEEWNLIPKYEVDTKKGRLKANPQVNLEMPPVDDQGEEGSCNAWASGYAVRSYLYHIAQGTSYEYPGTTTRNNKSVFSPRFLYNMLLKAKTPVGSQIMDSGSKARSAYDLMQNTGICTLEDMPYIQKHFADEVSPAQIRAANNYKIVHWSGIEIDNDKIKKIIADKRLPVHIVTKTDDHLNTPTNYPNDYVLVGKEKEWVWKNFGKPDDSKHSMVLVGYDDTKNAFKVMNSWGQAWGNKGFIWMDYSLLEKVVDEAYFASNTVDGLKQSKAGTIDVSYSCDGPRRIMSDLGTYHYELLINMHDVYDDDLEKYIYLVTPDKLAYYKISLGKSLNKDGKTFRTSFTYAPFDKRSVFYNGQILATPYYKPYNIQYMLTNDESELAIENNYGGYAPPKNMDGYTPPGTYEFLIVVKDKDGKLIPSRRGLFPKAFFDISICDRASAATPPVSLYVFDF